jgi:hypothetical protein
MMQKFSTFLAESAKNVHMTHLEDSIFTGGVDGTRQAINFLRSLRDMLAGNSKSSVNITTKFDGAPAIFAGIDPSDGQFFVAKKGIFNKNPKVYKTEADIDEDTSGDLNTKLKLALKYLPALGIKDVVQGDFLYAREDLSKETIDGVPHLTFQPNTIVYAVPMGTPLAKEIAASKIGIVWHTSYKGSSFENMQASFGKPIAKNHNKTSGVWSIDATYKDLSGTANFTEAETKEITAILSEAGKIFNKIPKKTFDTISDAKYNVRLMAFVNSFIREGVKVGTGKQYASRLEQYLRTYYQKEIDKVKTDKAKQTKIDARDEMLAALDSRQMELIFDLFLLLSKAKLMVVRKLDQGQGTKTFLKTKDGLEVTGQEGFVAIDHTGSNTVKLVDRLQFSQANFSPRYIKGWQR